MRVPSIVGPNLRQRQSAAASDGGAHEWELLAGEINIIAVEVKSAQAAMDQGGGEAGAD